MSFPILIDLDDAVPIYAQIERHKPTIFYSVPTNYGQLLAHKREGADFDLSGIDERELTSSASGPGLVSAVCVRDHWNEMMQEERDWCVESVCAEVMETANVWNEMARMQRYSMSADRSCARVVSLLLVRAERIRSRARGGKVFHVALPNGDDRTVILRSRQRNGRRHWEWSAW